jgi:hypothetical protein
MIFAQFLKQYYERSDEHDYDHPKRKIPEIRIQLRSCHSCDTHVIYRRYTRASIMIRGPVHKLVPPYHMMLNALTSDTAV